MVLLGKLQVRSGMNVFGLAREEARHAGIPPRRRGWMGGMPSTVQGPIGRMGSRRPVRRSLGPAMWGGGSGHWRPKQGHVGCPLPRSYCVPDAM